MGKVNFPQIGISEVLPYAVKSGHDIAFITETLAGEVAQVSTNSVIEGAIEFMV
ncbi:hypothetical protein [Frankia sp. AvcI1]|uniref:hypothetical protein n=1 Tax=Frankia sp. AvcI1 TaxID=573496 RepID=UPI001F25FB9A|nr:hypothetical protein [Frankia sp. AvcI1]